MAGDVALQTQSLRKSYGDVVAVESLSLQVDSGSVVGFLGPNGAGKTTVIRMLSTVLAPDAGTFSVAGVPHTRPLEIRRRLGVLPESAGYPTAQTAEEWLTFHARLFGRTTADARGTARALVNDPQVVFLDEPTLGLDPAGQLQVLDLVSRIAREHGVTVVLSTHLLAEV